MPKKGYLSKPVSKTNEEEKHCFFLVSALAIYTNEAEELKQRHLNVLLETETPNLPKASIDSMQRSVMQRLKAENDIDPHQFKDIVILNVNLLGVMPPNIFHGIDDTDQAPQIN